MKKLLTILMLLVLAVPAWAGEQTILITSNDASGVYYTSKGGVKMEMSGGMNNEGFMVQRHYDQINFRSFNFKIKKIVFRCLDNTLEGDNDSFYWGPTTMYIAPNTSVDNVVAGTLTTPYNNSTYMAKWESSPTYPDGLPIGQQLTIKCQGHPVRFAYIEITIDKEDGDMYELVTRSDQIVTGDKTYMLVHRLNSSNMTGDALSSNQKDESTSGHFLSTSVDLYNNGFLARATGDVMFLRFTESNNSSYPYYIIAGGAYFRTESSNSQETIGSGDNAYTTYRLSRTNGMSLPNNTDYALASTSINSSETGGTNGFEWYAQMAFKGTSNHRIRHYNGGGQFRNIQNGNSYVAQQRVFLYKPAQRYEVFTATDGNGTITLRDGIVVDGSHNYSQMMDNVSFIVAPTAGYKIKNVTITNLTDDTEITPTVTTTTLGQTYIFSMPGSDVRVYAEFEQVQYHSITMEVKPSSMCGNILLTDGYIVQGDNVMSYEGANVAFNVNANFIDLLDQSQGKYELSYVSVTNHATDEETILAASEVGKYNFSMPDADVTITAYFFDNVTTPLYLLGTANGETWHTYGPRFNYDNDAKEYYIDVYFKGTGDYGLNTGDNWGEFRVTWKVDPNDNWGNIKNQGKQGHPHKLSVDPLTNQLVCKNGGTYRLSDGESYGLSYDDGWTEYDGNWTDQEDYKFTLDPGIYRIYVGTQASQDAGGLGLNVLKAVKRPIILTFDPAGGVDAASAVEVPQNQLVSLQGDLYNKIKAINPNEADGNFWYKATVDGNTTNYENAGASTTQIATLDVVNEGETVTQLEGWNYLGWIVASNSGYYKVIETPLNWIEKNGDKDKTYTVSDRLQGVYAQDGHLWCKDLGDQSIVKTSPNTEAGQIDFLGTTLKTTNHRFATNMRINDWDQSNWVELDFTGLGTQSEAQEMAQALQGHYITAKSVTGVYTDDVNYTITLTSNPIEDGDAIYVPNTYCTANFLETNLTADGVTIGEGENAKNYYFLNPKVQEYAIVTFAMWDKTNQIMVIPDNTPFNGAVKFGRWDWNDPSGQLDMLNNDNTNPLNAYEFHVIVQRANKSYGTPATASGVPAIRATDSPSGKTDQTASTVIMAQPLDLEVEHPLPTGINGVVSDAKVVGVEYVNLAGVRSSKPFAGMNIVVTRYSDGSTTTSKVIK